MVRSHFFDNCQTDLENVDIFGKRDLCSSFFVTIRLLVLGLEKLGRVLLLSLNGITFHTPSQIDELCYIVYTKIQ